MECLEKIKKSETVKHFLGRTYIDPAPITRKESESFENKSYNEGNVYKSEEDILLNDNALSTDSSSSDDNESYDEENKHNGEQLL